MSIVLGNEENITNEEKQEIVMKKILQNKKKMI